MTYSGGTSLANEFIVKYTSNGHLLDLYSDEWVKKKKDLEGMSTADFKSYDAKFGTEYKGHMLLIDCEWYESQESNFSKDLINVFPKYKDQLRDYSENVYYDPSFILINLVTKQMLAVGLGRKNGLFMTDVETNVSVELNSSNNLGAQALFGNLDKAYLANFLKLDHAGVVYKFLASLQEMGAMVYSRDCDCTEYLFYELQNSEPDEDGMFEVDGDTYSDEERSELIENFEQCQKVIKVHEDYLMSFFPNIDFCVINEY